MMGGLNSTEIADFVDMAISLGTVDLWNAKPWSFRRKQHTIATTAEQDAYELPHKFAAIATAREKDSAYGAGLAYLTKDEFDKCVANPSTHAGGTPLWYTVYSDEGKKYIQFFPRPSSTSMYLNILTEAPSDVSQLPESASAALLAVCQKYLFMPGTTPFDSTHRLAEREVMKMEIEDALYVEDTWKFQDSSYEPVKTDRPWV